MYCNQQRYQGPVLSANSNVTPTGGGTCPRLGGAGLGTGHSAGRSRLGLGLGPGPLAAPPLPTVQTTGNRTERHAASNYSPERKTRQPQVKWEDDIFSHIMSHPLKGQTDLPSSRMETRMKEEQGNERRRPIEVGEGPKREREKRETQLKI